MNKNEESLGSYETPSKEIMSITKVLKEKVKEVENLFQKIMTKNIPNMGKDLVIQVHKAKRSPQNVNPKCSFPRHRVIKLSKNKQTNHHHERNFYSSSRKQNGIIQGNSPIKLSADVSAGTLQAREQ